ncbi:plant UBX domain-containing protein 4 isoform X1 [Sesamum indicum]|uniref:Plant UBX domain-containing protein 4 isoform X1 n=1 Tax=Sesamum indicum TaxID=4182 RepID=A0A6I9UD65_SESIN|nr:plant UBX domain-containing protein 4 isoform X1 [Sesamum indicum]XP_020553979.1 plant UBX domain-containing protein 4 isoform X1 [Sesamum indicum]
MSSLDKKKPSTSRIRGIRTLSDLNRRSVHDSDVPQENYTGGEKSGMLVQDPSEGDDVDAIFDQARQLGAVQGPLQDIRPSSGSKGFTGRGRLLTGEPVPNQQPESVVHNIVFWRNGFTVNDGPLRRLDDPGNAPFLESIRKSECPKELEPADRRSSVHVNLIRREENCPEPEIRHVPFQGVGRTLGGSSATESGPETTIAAPTNSAPSPSTSLVVDASLPSTTIQLRMADGTPMVAHFNHHHTIADIRSFIDASRPGGSTSYQLQSVGFPPKVLSDLTQTVQQAGLLNSVLLEVLCSGRQWTIHEWVDSKLILLKTWHSVLSAVSCIGSNFYGGQWTWKLIYQNPCGTQ